MTFSERMKDALEQGLAMSKEIAIKAGEKAQDLGERGILMLEIKQLEGQAQRLLTRLGNEVYYAFTDRDQDTVEREDSVFKATLDEINKVKDAIETKEDELKSRK